MAVSRRRVLQGLAAAGAVSTLGPAGFAAVTRTKPLEEFEYDQVEVLGARQLAQRANARGVLMALTDDSLIQPFRRMAGRPAPGESLGGWYEWRPDYDFHHDDAGFAPAHCFGQWTSAMARLYASSRADGSAGDEAMRERARRLHALLRTEVSRDYFELTRFPAYSYDKLVCGLVDGHQLAGDTEAFTTLERVSAVAGPSLPGRGFGRELQYVVGKDASWMWDESYTMPENLYRAAAAGAGQRYRTMAREYLVDRDLFEPLSRDDNALADKHAYSDANALCSAMAAYFADGSEMHFEAARNGFDMILAQSFVTGGWGPDETFRKPGYDQVAASLINTHNSFEVPCGSYAHMKLTRGLLRATRHGRYGDSMERVLHNTVLGALPMETDGRAFYYADYNEIAKRVYSVHRWPCCAGSLPQVAADYGINSYLREPGAVWVTLYQPSVLRWREGGSAVALEQTGNYPEGGGRIQLQIRQAAQPVRFALHLRVPAWAGDGAKLHVNGQAVSVVATKGFMAVERVWREGDTVQLELPMTLRLEALPPSWVPFRIGPMHLDTVAVLRGPEVLFALREPWETGPLGIKTEALLKAEQTGAREWTVQTPEGARKLVPWTEVGARTYTTYLKAL